MLGDDETASYKKRPMMTMNCAVFSVGKISISELSIPDNLSQSMEVTQIGTLTGATCLRSASVTNDESNKGHDGACRDGGYTSG